MKMYHIYWSGVFIIALEVDIGSWNNTITAIVLNCNNYRYSSYVQLKSAYSNVQCSQTPQIPSPNHIVVLQLCAS